MFKMIDFDARIMEVQRRIERKPQKYWFKDNCGLIGYIDAAKKEELGKLNLTNYNHKLDADSPTLSEEIEQNARVRFNAICGYRNEPALKMDLQARLTFDLIRMDEMRVCLSARQSNSEQTPVGQ